MHEGEVADVGVATTADFEHPVREVGGDDGGTGARQRGTRSAGSGGEVEDLLAGLRRDRFGGGDAPEDVVADGQHCIGAVVAR
jgi:hypothetical protein